MKFPDQFRVNIEAFSGRQSAPGDPYGAFYIPARYACGRDLRIVASDGTLDEGETDEEGISGWEHVSISLATEKRREKCPSWYEMCVVKDLFWDETECVVQYHPPKSEHISFHPGCLHLWRCTKASFPLPPGILIGIKDDRLKPGETLVIVRP